MYTLTRSATTVSLVGLAEALPLLALAPFAGVFVDRWSRARTMAGAVSVRAVVILPLLLVTTGAGVPLIVVVVLGANAASQFFQPAASAALPVIVGPERVGRANSLFTLVTGVSAAIGPAGAAALFVVIGPHATVVALSLIYALAVPLLLAVPAPRPTTRGAPRTSVPRELRDGLAYVHRSPLLLALIVVVFVALLGVGALSVIDVVFVTRALHRPVANAGVLLLANGTGQILGGLLVALTSAWATHRYHRLLGGATLVCGAAFGVYALAPTLLVATMAVAVAGLSLPSILVSVTTLIQLATADAFMGRVMSLINALVTVATIISLAVSGVLTDLLGVREIIGAAAALLLLSGALALVVVNSTPGARARREDPDVVLADLSTVTHAPNMKEKMPVSTLWNRREIQQQHTEDDQGRRGIPPRTRSTFTSRQTPVRRTLGRGAGADAGGLSFESLGQRVIEASGAIFSGPDSDAFSLSANGMAATRNVEA